MHVIDVMAMVMEVLCRNTCDRSDGDGDGHCYRLKL